MRWPLHFFIFLEKFPIINQYYSINIFFLINCRYQINALFHIFVVQAVNSYYEIWICASMKMKRVFFCTRYYLPNIYARFWCSHISHGIHFGRFTLFVKMKKIEDVRKIQGVYDLNLYYHYIPPQFTFDILISCLKYIPPYFEILVLFCFTLA